MADTGGMRNTLFLLSLASRRADLRKPENAWLLNEVVLQLLANRLEPNALA